MKNEKESQCWSGPVPHGEDGIKFSIELWEYFNTMEAVSGLRSSMGAQIEQLRLGSTSRGNVNPNTGPEEAQLDAIAKFRKTWAKLCLISGHDHESLSRFYGGGKVSEFEVVSAHKAFREVAG